MSNSCRTCAKDILNGKPLNIFAKNEYNTKEQIELLTGVLLPNKSGFPSCICTGCHIRLTRVIEFRECCIAAQQIFLRRLTSNEQNNKESDKDVSKLSDTKSVNDPLEIEYSQPGHIKVEAKLNIQDDESLEDNSNSDSESVEYEDYEEEVDYELQYDYDEATEQSTEQKFKQKTKKIIKLNSELPEAACICDQCGKSFSNKRNLHLHQLRHTGNKTFECKHCDLKFYTASLLKIHGRKHTNPFKCSYCDETFGYNSSRKRHERIHRNERPFKCQYCDKSFICSTSKKGHENTHVRIRSYECKACGVWFMSSKHLNSHYRTKSHIQTVMNDQSMGINGKTKF